MKRCLFAVLLACAFLQQAAAQERVQAGDAGFDCAAIAAEQGNMQKLVEAGNSERTLGQAAAGGATNVGTQVATGQVAGSMFGAFGGLAAKLAGVAAQQVVEDKLGPDEAARAAASKAAARKDFLDQLAKVKQCESGGAGRTLSAAEFQQVAGAPASGTIKVTPMSPPVVAEALQAPVRTLDTAGLLDGNLNLKGRKVYLSEFRLLFEIGGKVSASTRGGYFLGSDYGSTRASVNYTVPNIDVAAYQLIADKAFEDFKARMAASGVDMQYAPPEGGAVYDATENASQPGLPVFSESNLGHVQRRFLVMAPTGMKLVPRGWAGIGAGNISKRIEWGGKNLEGMSVTQEINIAAHETSGSGSSIWKRASAAAASSQLSVGNATELLIQTHVNGGIVRTSRAVFLDGQFANFRTVSEFDSDKDMTSRMVGTMQNLMGQGANKVKKVEKEVDLDAAAMARLSLQGIATVNQAIAELVVR